MKKPAQHLIAEVSRRQSKVEMTIGIDLGDVEAITARPTKKEKWSIAAVSERHLRDEKNGLPRCLRHEWRWKRNALDLDQPGRVTTLVSQSGLG